jgi:hypothetical protein
MVTREMVVVFVVGIRGLVCVRLHLGGIFGFMCKYILQTMTTSSAIDHRTWKTGLPVRSAVLKPCAGRLVVGWVTTSEYLLLIVLHFWTPVRHFQLSWWKESRARLDSYMPLVYKVNLI